MLQGHDLPQAPQGTSRRRAIGKQMVTPEPAILLFSRMSQGHEGQKADGSFWGLLSFINYTRHAPACLSQSSLVYHLGLGSVEDRLVENLGATVF